MNRCLRCVIPDTRPDTAFVDGVCSACIAYQNRPAIDWQARREALLELLARSREVTRGVGLGFDCIVPSSGGKDSHYQVLTLIELGARPLVVTASTCHLTPIGRANLDNLKRYATTIEYSPNRQVRAKLNRIGLTQVGDISWPEHVAIFTTPFKLAVRTGIGLIFYGENPQNQYGAPTIDHQQAMHLTMRWRSEFGGFLGLRPHDLIGVDGLTQEDMWDYMPPTDEDLEVAGVEAHFLGQYIPWDSHRNAEVARAAGFRTLERIAHEVTLEAEPPCHANWWPHENLDNAQTGLHDHMMYRKYGFGRGAAQISVDVRAGLVDRATALDWVERRDGLFPWVYAGVGWKEMAAHIDLDLVKLHKALDDFTNWNLFADKGEAGTWRPTLA